MKYLSYSKTQLIQHILVFNIPPLSSVMYAQNPPNLGSVYSGYVPQGNSIDPKKVIKKFGIFEFLEDLLGMYHHL